MTNWPCNSTKPAPSSMAISSMSIKKCLCARRITLVKFQASSLLEIATVEPLYKRHKPGSSFRLLYERSFISKVPCSSIHLLINPQFRIGTVQLRYAQRNATACFKRSFIIHALPPQFMKCSDFLLALWLCIHCVLQRALQALFFCCMRKKKHRRC